MTYDPTRTNRTLAGPNTSGALPSRFPVGSSEWWIDKLTRALISREQRFDRLTAYYRGAESLTKLASVAWTESGLASVFPNGLRTNHSRLIVNATAQRLSILGFRLAGSARVDTEAARIWRANDLESQSDIALTESLVKGECPVLVEPNPRDLSTPIITPQDPRNTIVWTASGDRRIRLAALKTWWDEATRLRQYQLFLPDRIERWQDAQPGQMTRFLSSLFAVEPAPWQRLSQAVNPIGEIPLVTIPNEPLLAGQPEAEHEAALDQIDHYNRTLMEMAISSNELAYPQRFATGVDEDDATDDDEQPSTAATTTGRIQTGQNRWITTPAPDATFGQFAAAQLDNYTKALDTIRAGIATVTFTPYHFLLNMPSSVPPSGESLTASESPLTDKCRGHQRDKGSAWRTAMRLAFLMAGDSTRAEQMRGGVVVWRDPERRTESQHIDALGKLRTMLGVPEEATWELIPATPEEIARWIELRNEAAAAAPAPTATAPTTGADGASSAPGAAAQSTDVPLVTTSPAGG